MPTTSNFRITQEQEKKLIIYLNARRLSLQDDNRDRLKIDSDAWARYWMDVRHRNALAGQIYPLSNLPLPVFAMVADHFVSRLEDSTSADEPYFHFEAVNVEGDAKRLTYNRYFNWKLGMGKCHETMVDSNLASFIQKASILKAVFSKEVSQWREMDVPVLHNRATSQPIEILEHGPILQEDEFVSMPDPVDKSALRQHLKADPTFILDLETRHYWALPADGINRSQVLFAGAKSEQVSYDRFFCPSDARTVDEADCVLELQDQMASWYRSMWLERPWCKWADYEQQVMTGNSTPKTATVSENGGITSNPSGAAGRPVENRSFDTLNPLRRVGLFWVRRDVLTDGHSSPQEFAVWMDLDLNVIIYYEWQALLCPDKLRPYSVTALSKPPNRWCGVSIWERGHDLFDAVDRLFNGEFYRTLQQANPPKGGDPTAAKEEPTSIDYDPTKYYDLKQGKTMDDLLQYAKVPDTNQRTQMVLEFIIFWIQLWLGVSNIAQGDYAAAPENATKYGIQKTLQEASLLGRRWIRRKLMSDEDHLAKLVKIVIATLPENQEETYLFTDGDQQQLATIMGAEIKTLQIQVKIVEEQHHEAQDIERCNAALAVQERFFSQLSPEVRAAMRPFLIEILTMLNFKDPEAALPDFAATPMTEAMMGGAPLTIGPDGKPTVASTGDAPAPVQKKAVPDTQSQPDTTASA